MASCTESFRVVVLLLALLMAQGCATGRLLEAGRRTESVLHYEAAYTDGWQLWLVYSAGTTEGEDPAASPDRRSAAIELAALDPAAGYPVDAFPLERAAASDVPSHGAQPVAVCIEVEDCAAAPSLLVDARDARHTGFALAHFEGVPDGARFHSAALIERRTAAWVYPVLPFALTWDAVWTPVLTCLATPFLLVGE
jgi:hypothetical protein